MNTKTSMKLPGSMNSFGSSTRSFFGQAIRDLGRNPMVIALLVTILLFQLLTNGILLRQENLSNLVVQNGYILILAIGMVMVIVGGHIDLSAGSVAGFVGAVSGVLAMRLEIPSPIAILLSLLVGALIGAWQGFWIAYVGVPSFIVTLAGMITFSGLTLAVLGDNNIGSFPDFYRSLGNGFVHFNEDGLDPFTLAATLLTLMALTAMQIRSRRRRISFDQKVDSLAWFVSKLAFLSVAILYFGIMLANYKGTPVVLIILGALIVIYTVITQRSVLGRQVYAVGGNRDAAKLSGIRTKRVDFLLFVNMGVLAGLAGIVFTARLNLAATTGGTGFELEAISAAFVGGAAVTGGVGTVAGAIIGGLIIGILNNGMSIMGLGVQWQLVVKGLVLLAAVAFGVISMMRSGSFKK